MRDPKKSYIVISGVHREVDGEYELPTFTARHWRILKQVAGVRQGELADAIVANDQDVWIAFAMIALHAAGKGGIPVDVLLDSDDMKLEVHFATDDVEEEEAALPPVSAPADGANENGKSEPGGLGSSSGSAVRAIRPSPSGSPGLATGSISDREISAI